MAEKDLFNFGGFLKRVNKKREQEAELEPADSPASGVKTTESQPSEPSMSQSDFLYGPEGLRRKPKEKR